MVKQVDPDIIIKQHMAILDSSDDAIIGIYNDGTIFSWNKAAENFYCYTYDEAINQKISDICKSVKQDEGCKELIQRYENGENISNFETERYDKHGFIKKASVTISTIELSDKKIGYSFIVKDISKQNYYNLQIHKLKEAIDQSANVVIITDIEGNIEFINKKFTEITGYDIDDAFNQNPRFLKSGEHDDSFYKEMWKTIMAGQVWQGELINKRKNGELYWDKSTITPVFDLTGNIINFIAIKEDVTEIKKNKEELIKAKEMAEKASSLKSIILGNLSHELRTPLNGIIGGLQILDLNEEDENKQVVDIIKKSAERLNDSIGLILELSKIQNDNTDIELEEIDITDYLKSLKYTYEVQCARKKIDFILDVPKESQFIKINTALFNQMMHQLMQNSLKFTKKGKIELGVKRNNDKIVIYLHDEGEGIPKEKLDVIFDEFRQVSEGINRKYEGLGLGLTFVSKIVDIFNGKIDIESELNEGTKVNITFIDSK